MRACRACLIWQCWPTGKCFEPFCEIRHAMAPLAMSYWLAGGVTDQLLVHWPKSMCEWGWFDHANQLEPYKETSTRNHSASTMRLLCSLPRFLIRGHLGAIPKPLHSRVKQRVPLRASPSQSFRLSTTVMANIPDSPPEKVYLPNIEVENLEEYKIGGYHPIIIGDTFHGRYEVAHKLGFGGYSTVWLARDRQLQKYVALKVLAAHEAKPNEAKILRLLSSPNSHPGRRFVPLLLDEFAIDGPNGRHLCLVQDVAACSVAISKEWSSNNLFPLETARSIAAQLILGISYLHSRGVCHGGQRSLDFTIVKKILMPCLDLHIHNFFIYGFNIDHLSPDEIRDHYSFNTSPVKRVDGASPEPHAPPYAVLPMPIKTPANKLIDPIIKISDYGTSFLVTNNPSPELYTPDLYRPPEALFEDQIIPFAADIWTLGVNLYEVLGERVLFETFTYDRDDILADIVNTLGLPPQRWWDAWANRGEFFEKDGEWRKGGIVGRIYTPAWRPLEQRLWGMGRGETPETCEWDVEGGELRALSALFRGVLAWEPDKRWTAEDLVRSEYMVRWALPAWERQRIRGGEVLA